jgi:hypothetical protein
MSLAEKEARIRALGLPWFQLMESFKGLRDTRTKLPHGEDAEFRAYYEHSYEGLLDLIIKTAEKRAEAAKQVSKLTTTKIPGRRATFG